MKPGTKMNLGMEKSNRLEVMRKLMSKPFRGGGGTVCFRPL